MAEPPVEPPPPAGRRSVHRHRVRYLECDQQGVVFNMWYLGYLDEAMADHLAAGGLPYPQLLASGVDVQLVHSELDWQTPLRWGDVAEVEVRTARVGNRSFDLAFRVAAGQRVTATGRTTYVCVATDGSGSTPVPPALRAALGLSAPGQPSR